ncbi:hypothetical protein AALB81_01970 [Lachnospiraceae bacterium 48-33]
MDDDFGTIIAWVLIVAAIIFVIYCIVIIAGILVSIAGIGGAVWGGGTSIVNYIRSFKENMIDSNRAVA